MPTNGPLLMPPTLRERASVDRGWKRKISKPLGKNRAEIGRVYLSFNGTQRRILMPTRKKRVAPWLTLSVAQGNAIQLGGLLVAAALAWYAGRAGSGGEGERGARRAPDGCRQPVAGVLL